MPGIFSGVAHIADPQSFIFSPYFLALAWLLVDPDFRAFDAAVLALPLLGGAGLSAWLFARSLLPHAALLAGFVFLAGGSVAWRLQHVGQLHSLAVLPWLLFALDRAIASGSLRAALAAGILAGLLLAGRDQVALLGAYLAAGFALWRWLVDPLARAAWRRSLGMLALAALFALAAAAIPLLLSALEAARSNRPTIALEDAGRGSLHPALLFTLFTPHLFGSAGPMADFWGPPSFAWPDTGLFLAQNMGVLYFGWVGLLLIPTGFSAIAQRPFGKFVWISTLLILLYALGWYTPFFEICYRFLPGVDLFRRPADATFLLAFLFALVSGLACDAFLRDPRPRNLRLAVLLGLVGLSGAAILAGWRGRLVQAAPALFEACLWFALASALLFALARGAPRRRALLASALVLLTILELARNNGPNGATGLPVKGEVDWSVLDPRAPEPTLDLLSRLAQAAAPEAGRRVELVGLGYAWPNAPLIRGLDHTLGHNPLRPADYVAAVGAEDTIATPEQRRFTSAFPGWRTPLADLLGLRWIATPLPIERLDPTLAYSPLPLIARTESAFIYGRESALPRLFVATRWTLLDREAVLRFGRWPEVDLTTTVLLEEPPAIRVAPNARSGTTRFVRLGNDELVIEAFAPDGGFLVLHDPWHPWWCAEIDGQSVPILRANLLFRAVALPPGRSLVRFRFTPLSGAFSELRERVLRRLEHS